MMTIILLDTRDILTRKRRSWKYLQYHFVFSFISIEAVKIDWIYLLLIEIIMVWGWLPLVVFYAFLASWKNGWFDCLPFQKHYCQIPTKMWKMVLVEPPLVFNWNHCRKHEFLLIRNNWKIRRVFREILCVVCWTGWEMVGMDGWDVVFSKLPLIINIVVGLLSPFWRQKWWWSATLIPLKGFRPICNHLSMMHIPDFGWVRKNQFTQISHPSLHSRKNWQFFRTWKILLLSLGFEPRTSW